MTFAQKVTKLGYEGVSWHGDFRVQCRDIEDAQKCVSIIGSYNEFFPEVVIDALDINFNHRRYYNEGNKNNGGDLLDFFIGRESSPVLYVQLVDSGKARMVDSKGGGSLIVNRGIFENWCKRFKIESRADAYRIEEKGDKEFSVLVAWFWWD